MADKPFPTEVALCAAFIKALPKQWTAYAETAGWDILLVRKDGYQLGIEAKLRMNTDVVNQVIEEYGSWAATRNGPDYRAVLVPSDAASGFGRIADYIGFAIIRMRAPQPPETPRYLRHSRPFDPALPVPPDQPDYSNREWHEWWPTKRHELPDYVPDVAAGAPSPLQLTHWKICAIKIQVTLETRGYVTREDFKHIGIDHRRFLARDGYLRPGAQRGQWGGSLGFAKQHPTVYAQIKADADKWILPSLPLDDPPTNQ